MNVLKVCLNAFLLRLTFFKCFFLVFFKKANRKCLRQREDSEEEMCEQESTQNEIKDARDSNWEKLQEIKKIHFLKKN